MARKKKKDGDNLPQLDGDQTALVAMWGSRKVSRLNRIADPSYCGKLTVRELAAIAIVDKTNFPDGLDTPLCLGDFEGNFCTNVLSISTGGARSDHLCLCCDPHGGMAY